MCSISGFFSLGPTLPNDASQLLTCMAKSMRHRGPDGQGTCLNQKYGLGLAHTRLAIIDPTPEGRQPFFSQDKTVVTVFNGEIYNYKELRAELSGRGRIFKTKTDTEVIVQAYQEWGIACLERLEGIFGLAIFDATTNSFFLARDRIGVKPVYFSLQGGFLSFASEQRVITKLPWISGNISKAAIYHYLTFMACPAPLTTTEGIYKLPAGYFIKVDANKKVTFNQWYCPIKSTASKVDTYKNISEHEASKELLKVVDESVQKRMVSDVPVASFLSGGLDSSLITALVARKHKNLHTFNVSFQGDDGTDDKTWAKKTSLILGTTHHELQIKKSDIKSLIKAMNHACDQPLADCVNVPFLTLSNFCSAKGFKVALVGEGADELFFGYPEYKKYLNLERRLSSGAARLMPGWGKTICALSSRLLKKPSLTALLENWSQNHELFWGAATAFKEHEKRLVKSFEKNFEFDPIIEQIFPDLGQSFDSSSFVDFYARQVRKHFPNPDFALRTAFLELKNRIPELLLARADNMGMAQGLEARVPFLDPKVIEFSLALPKAVRASPGQQLKPLLKKAAEQVLPHELVHRPKVGFSAPIKTWFEQNLVSPAKKTDRGLPSPGKDPLRRWVLSHLKSKLI